MKKIKHIEQIKAFADPARWKILKLLRGSGGEIPVSRFLRLTRIEPTLLSHHLKVLLNAGLVVRARSGKQMFYQLNPTVANAAHLLDSQKNRAIETKDFTIIFK